MRFLAVDLGGKRTGLAVGDDGVRLVSPVAVIEEADEGRRFEAVAAAIEEHGVDAVVVGLPLNMDGTAGGPARAAEAFAANLRERSGLPVHLQDERLTSAAADEAVRGQTRKRKKKRQDAEAAAVLLRDFLDAQA